MVRYVLTILFLALAGPMAANAGHPVLIPNEGQWQGNFLAKADLTFGAFFLDHNGYSVVFQSPEDLEDLYGHMHMDNGHEAPVEAHLFAVKQRFISSLEPNDIGFSDPAPGVFNYIIGNDPSKWRTEVKGYREVTMGNIYPGIDQVYKHLGQSLKYEFLVQPGVDPSIIQWKYEGTSQISIHEGQIHILTPYGTITEGRPIAYQIVNGQRVDVTCSYSLDDGIYSFQLGGYDATQPLVIDPTLVFATFSGSTADNWGFTATYDLQGNFYAGGVAFGTGYPVTTGAYQTTHNNSNDPTLSYVTDLAITKFNPTGTSMIYSTYLGGSEFDLPLSMIVDNSGNLVIYGVTGSNDFPTTNNAYQDSLNTGPGHNFNIFRFNEGIDIFVAKLNSTGANLLASTYVGGSGIDGANRRILYNYGDETRGEVVVDDQNQIYIASNTESLDFPGLPSTVTKQGVSDAVVFRMDPNLTTLTWASLFGGTGNETGFSLKVLNNELWLAGGTTSNDLPGTSQGVNSSFQGQVDGFVARFSSQTGGFQRATYLGTAFYDQAFLLDLDKFGTVYVFGQTGGPYTTTPGNYNIPNSRQFIHRLTPDLDQTLLAFLFGSGLNKYDMVPSAFEVDDCLKIFTAGWNGTVVQTGYPASGNTGGLPTTPDAIQSTTDNSDFYFAVFSAYADSLLYATFYGGAADEHIDGGTSRFSPDGTIYQGVCGGCSQMSFPTTPGVVGPTNNSSNCNFAGIKINFETSVTSIPEIDTTRIDTTCGSLIVRLNDLSQNASSIWWEFPDGSTSTLSSPTIVFDTPGTYTIRLAAMDTICDISDTATLTLNVRDFLEPEAIGDVKYRSCDQEFEARFQDLSENSQSRIWFFGDGVNSKNVNPVHNYPGPGTYVASLVAIDTCGQQDSTTFNIEFDPPRNKPEVYLIDDSCQLGNVNVVVPPEIDDNYVFVWAFPDGQTEVGTYPSYRFPESGSYMIHLTLTDTFCNQTWEYDLPFDIVIGNQKVFIPSAFSPNGDGINEELKIVGSPCVGAESFMIFDSWGGLLFETDNPLEDFWDGKREGLDCPGDTYVYIFKARKRTYHGFIVLIR